MNKDALINIIVNDLKEVGLLMDAFKGEDEVNPVFVELAKKKLKSVEDELTLLSSEFGKTKLTEKTETPTPQEVIPEKTEPVLQEEKVTEQKKDTITSKEEKSSSGSKSDIAPESPAIVKEEKTPEPGTKVVEEDMPQPKSKDSVRPQKTTHKAKNNKAEDRTRLGDVLQKEKSALNERISRKGSNSDMIFSKPVNDVRKAMGINDRFFYQRELFDGNSDLFNQTLEQINSMGSFDDARNFLLSNFNWDKDNETTDTFLKIVKRRFL